MVMKHFDRRKFFKICGSYIAALSAAPPASAATASAARLYNPVLLTRNGNPMGARDFEVGQVYIFHYPYVTTPCIIFNLGESTDAQYQLTTEAGQRYAWTGGIGPQRSIVAYSAICSHRMTYPAKSASFLNYRHSKVVFFDENRTRQEKNKIIYCCSERSVYDPTEGARVIGGPAPQPLASIQLQYSDRDDSISAIGTTGGELFEQFLDKFEFRLQLDFKVVDVAQQTVEQVELQTIEEFTDIVVHC